MSVATFLLSWLSKQYGALDASVFLREQPGEWLVLEPHPGEPARGGEPLAARLVMPRDRARFTLGRDPGSDLVVNEPDVALAAAILEQDDEGVWTIRRAAADVSARLDGLSLGDFPVALGCGAHIELGGAALTYYDGEALHARLRKAA
jgi:hypothetical protein